MADILTIGETKLQWPDIPTSRELWIPGVTQGLIDHDAHPGHVKITSEPLPDVWVDVRTLGDGGTGTDIADGRGQRERPYASMEQAQLEHNAGGHFHIVGQVPSGQPLFTYPDGESLTITAKQAIIEGPGANGHNQVSASLIAGNVAGPLWTCDSNNLQVRRLAFKNIHDEGIGFMAHKTMQFKGEYLAAYECGFAGIAVPGNQIDNGELEHCILENNGEYGLLLGDIGSNETPPQNFIVNDVRSQGNGTANFYVRALDPSVTGEMGEAGMGPGNGGNGLVFDSCTPHGGLQYGWLFEGGWGCVIRGSSYPEMNPLVDSPVLMVRGVKGATDPTARENWAGPIVIEASGQWHGYSPTAPLIDAWLPDTVYRKAALVQPSPPNGKRYKSLTKGQGKTSDTIQPTWPTTPGATVVDGDITWRCEGSVNWTPGIGQIIDVDQCQGLILNPGVQFRGGEEGLHPDNPIVHFGVNTDRCVAHLGHVYGGARATRITDPALLWLNEGTNNWMCSRC